MEEMNTTFLADMKDNRELDELCQGHVGMKEAATKLVTLFGLVKTLNLPPTTAGYLCGNYWRAHDGFAARKELERQSALNNSGKTDFMLLNEIFDLLKEFPPLASTSYRNFSDEIVFPLWYFVLYDGSLSMIECVCQMHPTALETPLINTEFQVQSDKAFSRKMVYTLLDAACRSTQISEDVILFLAKNGPKAALTTKFNKGRYPYLRRLLMSRQGPDDSLELIKALVPTSEWNFSLFFALFNANYSAEVLHFALDEVTDPPEKGEKLGVNYGIRGEKTLLDSTKAIVLGRVIPYLKIFGCRPHQWTLDGLCRSLQIISSSTSLNELSLQIDPGMIVDADGADEKLTLGLENLLQGQAPIKILKLSVPKSCLGSILKGLAAGKIRNLTLFLEASPGMDSETSMESETAAITEHLLGSLQNGALTRLSILKSSRHKFSIPSEDSPLTALELEAEWDKDDLDSMIEILETNTTLEHLAVYDRSSRVDYTGFTSWTTADSRPMNNCMSCRSIFDQDRAKKIQHYIRLNRFGRKKVRCKDLTGEKLVTLLDDISLRFASMAKLPEISRPPTELDCFNVIFGLLLECNASIWRP